jgi:hypothetical protein
MAGVPIEAATPEIQYTWNGAQLEQLIIRLVFPVNLPKIIDCM